MRKLRILEIATSDQSLQYLLRRQLDTLREAGHEVVLASAPGDAAEGLVSAGYPFHALRYATQRWDPAADLRLPGELYQLFRRVEPDVVHTHIHKTAVLGRLVARFGGVPWIVNTQHGLYARPQDGALRKFVVYSAERLAAMCSNLELVQNPEDYRVLRSLHVPSARLVLLGNGVDLERFRPPTADERARARGQFAVPNGAVVVSGIGRLIVDKGWKEFAAAMRTAPGLVGLLAGPRIPQKRDAIEPQDLQPVRYLGMLERPEELYWASDILVMPSWGREGLPRATIEASACGLPVIGADSRGVRSVVANGRTGLLHPVGDVRALHERIMLLAGDAQLRVRMGAAGRSRAEQLFDEDRVIKCVLAAIEGRIADVRRWEQVLA
jgi:glycosyltransferase involved in cell wall biosynthesis